MLSPQHLSLPLLSSFNLTTWNLGFQMFAEDWLEEEGERRKMNYLWFERESATAAGDLATFPGGAQVSTRAWGHPQFLQLFSLPSPAELLENPLFAQKTIFRDTSRKCLLHLLPWQTLLSTGFAFQPLHLKAAHIKSPNFIHRLDELGNQSEVKSTSPGKHSKKKTPSTITRFAHDKALRENSQKHSKPTSSCSKQKQQKVKVDVRHPGLSLLQEFQPQMYQKMRDTPEVQCSCSGNSLQGNCWVRRKCLKLFLQPRPSSLLPQKQFS